MYIVYMATNKINEKKYIGLTSRSLQSRRKQHEKDSRREEGFFFHKAIKKYEILNFNWEILNSVQTLKEAQQIETNSIIEYNTFFKQKEGYNLTLGGGGRLSYTYNEIFQDAQKYETRIDWEKGNKSLYQAAYARGEEFYEKCCLHMIYKKVGNKERFTHDELLEYTKKYHSVREWREQDKSSYDIAQKCNMIDSCSKHMNRENLKLTKDEILVIAKQFSSVKDWIREHRRSHDKAKRIGIEFFEQCCIGLERGAYSQEEILKIAKSHSTQQEWRKMNHSSLNAAKRISKEFHIQCLSHMKKAKRGPKSHSSSGS